MQHLRAFPTPLLAGRAATTPRYRLWWGVLLASLAVLLVACGGSGSAAGSSSAPASTAPSASPSYPPGLSAFGFPNVTASVDYTPGQAATLSHGGLSVSIPAGAYSKPLKFQLLEGDTAYWQKFVPQGQKVISAFAFRSIDPATGEIVAKYDAPVVAALDDPAVTSQSVYYNTSPSNPPTATPNPVPATIQGHVLKHGNIASAVGWVITSPQS